MKLEWSIGSVLLCQVILKDSLLLLLSKVTAGKRSKMIRDNISRTPWTRAQLTQDWLSIKLESFIGSVIKSTLKDSLSLLLHKATVL
jgi:hypothetical protein